ncbi:MAG TPA: sigma-54 dependent transcriptional regulator [Dongiaceae bacterium]|nr:sigma-54 dependent transcriptional regulator [Dongiaceae bacterium]
MATTCVQPNFRPRAGMLIASPDSQFRRKWLLDSQRPLGTGHEAEGGAHALAKLREFECDHVVLDKYLPDLDAAEVAALIRERYPRIVVQVVDSRSDGAKSSEMTEGDSASERDRDAERASPQTIVEEPSRENEEPLPGMIGRSRAIRETYRLVRLVAPRDTTVLLTGETGTGKELAAQAVHELSARAKGPFVAVNCAAIPEALLESELFGHVRGAFTGAVQSRLGRIHVAHGGTLFLDEIGELPLGMQAKLLRFLQNGEVQRLGSSDVYRMNVRVICATNVNLAAQVQARLFRQDLYYRLAVFPIHLPALRQRLDDLEALAEAYLERLSEEANVPRRQLSREALRVLIGRRWEGNVRELQHVLERAFILAGPCLTLRAEHCQEFHSAELHEA